MCVRKTVFSLSFLLTLLSFANALYDWYPFSQQYYNPQLYQQGYPTYPDYSGYHNNIDYQYQQPEYQYQPDYQSQPTHQYQPQYQEYYNTFQNAHTVNPNGGQGIYNNQSPFDLSGFDIYWDYYKNITDQIRKDLNNHNSLVKNSTHAATYPFYQHPSTDTNQQFNKFVQTVQVLEDYYTPEYEVLWANFEHKPEDMKTTTQATMEDVEDLLSSSETVIGRAEETTERRGLFSWLRSTEKTITAELIDETTTAEATTAEATTTEVMTTTTEHEATTMEVTTTTEDENKIVVNEDEYNEYEDDDLEKLEDEETATTTEKPGFLSFF